MYFSGIFLHFLARCPYLKGYYFLIIVTLNLTLTLTFRFLGTGWHNPKHNRKSNPNHKRLPWGCGLPLQDYYSG